MSGATGHFARGDAASAPLYAVLLCTRANGPHLRRCNPGTIGYALRGRADPCFAPTPQHGGDCETQQQGGSGDFAT